MISNAIKLVLAFIFLFSLLSCGNNKIETPAYLSIKYYDNYDNEIYDAYISFYKGKKPINRNFEYVNDTNAINKCDSQEKQITQDKDFFRIAYNASSMFYAEKSTLEFNEFNRIKKMKFQCHVKSEKPNEECMASKFIEISKKEIGGDLDKIKELNSEQKDKFLENVLSELKFWEITGTCNYNVLKTSRIYDINDLL